MKRKNLITLTAGLLACVALVGVGFSAWIITNGDIEETQQITVTVGDIVDHRLSLTVGSDNDDTKVNFDCASDDNTGNITFSGDVNNQDNYGEDLEFSFTSTVALADTSSTESLANAIDGKTLVAYLDIKDSDDNAATISDDYITVPLSVVSSSPTSIGSYDSTDTTYGPALGVGTSTDDLYSTWDTTTDTSKYVLTTKCKFAWACFEGTNPGSHDNNNEEAEAAKSVLDAVSAYNDYTYTITVSIVATSSLTTN